MITLKENHKKITNYIIFISFMIINFILMLYHEPWRDEIHAWTMAKYLSVKDLFIVSRFDGHPILWHLILMPFAKLNFPIITLNIISWIIVCISAWFFLFKIKINSFFKYITLFTIPFLYIYSSISRNYCLILLFLMLIGIFYDKRYSYPIIYSIFICFLIHTHSLAWGIVAGLTITFHIYEIFLYFNKSKQNLNIKPIIIGFILIVINTITVILQLYGSTNSDYVATAFYSNPLTLRVFISIFIILLTTFLIVIIYCKKNIKEYIILLIGLLFQCFIYAVFYSSILLQRLILIFVFYLFFVILLSKTNIKQKELNIFCILYLIYLVLLGGLYDVYKNINLDIKYPYSSAIQMANYINNNLENEDAR